MVFSDAPILAVTGFFTIAIGLVVLLLGYYQAKSKNFRNHRNLMLLAAIVNAAFLIQYVTRFILGDETHFDGSAFVKNYIYLPILVIHISSAIISIYFILRHIIRSLKEEERSNQNVPYFNKDYRDNHRSFGRITFRLWLVSFIGGILIFLFLYVFY